MNQSEAHDTIVRQLNLLAELLETEQTSIARPSKDGRPWHESCAMLAVSWLPEPPLVRGLGLVTGIYDDGFIAVKDGEQIVVHDDCCWQQLRRVLNSLKKTLRSKAGLWLAPGFDVHTAARSQLINACIVNNITCFCPGGQPMVFNRRIMVAWGTGSGIRCKWLGTHAPRSHSDWLEADDDLRSAIIAHMNPRWRIYHYGVRYKRIHDGWSNKETAAIYDMIVNCRTAYEKLMRLIRTGARLTTATAKDLFATCGEPLDGDYYNLDREINWGEISDNLTSTYATGA